MAREPKESDMNIFKKAKRWIKDRWDRVTFRPYVQKRVILGNELQFYYGDLFGVGWYGPQHEPWPELEWIKNHGIRPGDVVVDCGANHGFSTVLFSQWTGESGKVCAFEPSPHNFGILQKNLLLNNIHNVDARQVAVGACEGELEMTTHPNSAVIRRRPKNYPFQMVPVRPLDVELDGIKVDFIKIDVEGYEFEVLEGAQKILRDLPALAVEVHVLMYPEREKGLSRLFKLIPIEHYHVDIQLTVDGPLRPWSPVCDTPKALAAYDLIHLFCQRK